MKLGVKFTSNDKRLSMVFSSNAKEFVADMGELQFVTEYVGGELYEGAYEITPKVDAQTMATKGKVLTNDMTVKAIPFFEASNNSGGSTVYIAKEI